jgi:hypothetical protein
MARSPVGRDAWWLASGMLIATCGVAGACPFCGVVGESLAMRRDAATVTAVAEAVGTAAPGPDGFLTQAFKIDQVLGGAALEAGVLATARVPGQVTGTALLFGSGAHDDLRWSAVAAHETVLGHAVAAPALTRPTAERLRWFATRLEHPEPMIADDAFTEFGLAPFDAVRDAAEAFDPTALERWVTEPGIDARRRGFYGLAAGIVAAETGDAEVRRRLLATLRTAIAAPADDFRAGFDGLLAGLLVAEGDDAFATFSQLGLFGPTARPVDQRHLLAALRFAWESLGDTVSRDRVAAATARLLASPAVAADAAIDCARYGYWAAVDDVAGLWETLGRDDPLVRRAVAGYLAACPLPAARAHLERLRAADPERLDAALEAAGSPFARP